MTSKNGVRYTRERKAEIVKRMVAPNNESVAQIAKEEGITEVTLYKWRKEARTAGVAMPGNGQTSDKWNSQDKFLIMMEAYAMNELEIAEYCRKKGLFREQIEACRNVCLQENGQVFDQSKQSNVQLKGEKKRAKNLEKDLQKKEKALAEAAALLLLRKKPKRFGGTTRKNEQPIKSRIRRQTDTGSKPKRCPIIEGLSGDTHQRSDI